MLQVSFANFEARPLTILRNIFCSSTPRLQYTCTRTTKHINLRYTIHYTPSSSESTESRSDKQGVDKQLLTCKYRYNFQFKINILLQYCQLHVHVVLRAKPSPFSEQIRAQSWMGMHEGFTKSSVIIFQSRALHCWGLIIS